ncbi:hypothetical protein YTPLAS18_03870 [Nitrospira sp.]|nr:hypothetical protein YTPLAS18_03870 [Nitrospira sp.]
MFLSIAGWHFAAAQEPNIGFTTDLGALSGAPDGTHFAMSFGLDYYVDRAFSFGLMTLFTPTGELNTYGFAGVAKYHIRFDAVTIVPFAGLGFIHMNLDKSGPPRIDDSSTSYWIPLGISAELPVSSNIALSSTLMVNLHRMQLSPIPRDDTSIAILFGVHFGP